MSSSSKKSTSQKGGEIDLAQQRNEYQLNTLEKTQMHSNPLQQFQNWLEEAMRENLKDFNAIALATANKKGEVSSRILLLKGIQNNSFRFFTNHNSQKGRDLEENPYASFTIHWKEMERQICVRGKVQKISQKESEAYFQSRPYESQISAWTSENQGGVVSSREELEQCARKIREKYPKISPLPPFWGGYALSPESLEFWQGRENRLHDFFRYTKSQNKTDWEINRLYP